MENKKKFHGFLKLFTIFTFVLLASIDNSVLEMAPSIYNVMISSFQLQNELPLGLVQSTVIWVVASSSIIWGFFGDRGDRKKLLLVGTLIWSSSLVFTPLVTNVITWLIVEIIAALGLGAIASIGFSVIADFISPKRRGIAMSLWSLSQSIGSAAGKAVAGFVIADLKIWWIPFLMASIGGYILVFLYFFTIPPQRGATEEEVKGLYYDFTIKFKDVKKILKKPTNIVLMSMGFLFQIIWGAITFLPFIFAKKIELQFKPAPNWESNAMFVGNIIAAIFWSGGFFSIIFAYLGDKLLRKTYKARPIISLIGICIGAPLGMLLILIPIDLSSIASVQGSFNIIFAIISELTKNRMFLLAASLGVVSGAFLSSDSPNAIALGAEVNIPEHRSTGFGIISFVNSIGRGIGVILLPVLHGILASSYPDPKNHPELYFQSLMIIMFLFIPTAACYVISFKYVDKDYIEMKRILKERAKVLRKREE